MPAPIKPANGSFFGVKGIIPITLAISLMFIRSPILILIKKQVENVQIPKLDKKINFSIVLDDNPNAYIDINNKLFISTGLFKYAPSYEAIVGVLAHEIGHLANFHISKRIKSLKNLQNLPKTIKKLNLGLKHFEGF